MRISLKKLIIAVLSLAVVMTVTGCWMKDVDELYKLPRQSEEYLQLQSLIENVLAEGAEYTSPTSGSHRQSVQLIDLNGDGTDEAIAFFKATGDAAANKALKIYIFKSVDDKYEIAGLIEGDGTGIESIDYTDLTGDGSLDIIVGWKISTELRMLGVYSMDDFEAAVLTTTDYSEYSAFDMDGNGIDNLMVIHYGVSESKDTVEMYSFNASGEAMVESTDLSQGLESIDAVTAGKLEGGVPALLVEGSYGDSSIITDVFAYVNRKLTNITANDKGVSSTTIRNYSVYSTDIDGDGITEIPIMQYLNVPDGQAKVWLFQWYTYSISGRHVVKVEKCATFHDYTDGWYFEIPDTWLENITVRREDKDTAERVIIFSVWNGDDEEPTDFLAVYTLTGSNRKTRAALKGRFVIRDDGDTIYAAKLLISPDEWEYMPDESSTVSHFHIIQTEWAS